MRTSVLSADWPDAPPDWALDGAAAKTPIRERAQRTKGRRMGSCLVIAAAWELARRAGQRRPLPLANTPTFGRKLGSNAEETGKKKRLPEPRRWIAVARADAL